MLLSADVKDFVVENNIKARVSVRNGCKKLRCGNITFFEENGIITLIGQRTKKTFTEGYDDVVIWNILRSDGEFDLEMLTDTQLIVETNEKEAITEVETL